MKSFNLDEHTGKIYAAFPEANRQPVIGITANYSDGDATLRDKYYEQVIRAGGTPVLIPPVADKNVIINTLDHIDALLLSGGGDINPLWCGEEPVPQLHSINATRDLAELLTVRLAYNRQIPMLGICRGIQTLAVALGGKVRQDINSQAQAPQTIIKHSQDADRWEPTHTINIEPDTILSQIFFAGNTPDNNSESNGIAEHTNSYPLERGSGGRAFVNSFHHQAVADPGPCFRVSATAPDSIIEAIESNEYKSILGVQWHPEWLGGDGLPLFRWIVEKAREFSEAKQLHDRILTLDTHCDTPMFFPQGVRLDQRDPHILYDLHKMTDGRQDAVIMAAYLPQPQLGEQFSQKVDIAGILKHNPQLLAPSSRQTSQNAQPSTLNPQRPSLSPTQYADLIFDKLEQIVDENSDYISIARTPADLYEDKRKGRKSIMFGIENGLALNHDLSNVRHFAQRGVVYITLCHNGDNDICDSNRGASMHNGVSEFGEKVIQRMNDEGIMVDLSHASEKSFYDALDISRTPIVCSHSNCRALCDVPRNLTDDQLRALAAKGGVAHTTFYHGFLRKDTSEATILDVIAHLEHAIDIMGIDHVGVGTDFDGDGTVRGCKDASELINFTLQLLRRRYSEQDIEQIWGGNWLRVMAQVQSERK